MRTATKTVASILESLLNAYDNTEIDGREFISSAKTELAIICQGCCCDPCECLLDDCNCDPRNDL